MKKDVVDLTDLNKEDVLSLIKLAKDIKAQPEKYKKKLKRKTLLMIFEKPSLRTRLSFEAGICRMGGHAIYYDVSTSPLGKGKETIADTAKTSDRYVDIIMARLNSHAALKELAENSRVPVINALTNFAHPCQILSDLMTISEKKGKLEGLKLVYFGDSNNNVTHSLMLGCAIVGMNIVVCCPKGVEYEPNALVTETAKKLAKVSKCSVEIVHDTKTAIAGADIVYTDSWMSYHILESQKAERIKVFTPYQVNSELMSKAKDTVIFMHCLPATRGMEQTAEVIDGPKSIVFDQAENRMHMQNALMLKLLKVE